MFSKILKSTARRRLFEILLKDSRQKFYLRELAERLQYSPGSLQRELSTLVQDGLLIAEKMGNMKFFSVNKKHPFIGELKKMLQKMLENVQEKPQKKMIFKAAPQVAISQASAQTPSAPHASAKTPSKLRIQKEPESTGAPEGQVKLHIGFNPDTNTPS